MDSALAEAVARGTRQQAVDDARADLKDLRHRAFEAGRERSRKITKTSRIDTRTNELRYNPAGRLLRDWYLHVYLNTLRANLGEPSVPIDAQQVEDTTALLHRITPGSEAIHALRAVAVLRDTGIDDATQVAAVILGRLRAVGERRAIVHAPDERFDGDDLRVHVTRHWYVRCYQDHVERATACQQPLTAVTDAESHQVALILESRIPHRLIGDDGVPLMTAHGTAMTPADRTLLQGGIHVMSATNFGITIEDPLEDLRTRVTRVWNVLDKHGREMWLNHAGVHGRLSAPWAGLSSQAQNELIRLYLRTDGPRDIHVPFEPTAIDQPAPAAAATMFNHPASSLATRLPDEPVSHDAPTISPAVEQTIRLLARGV